MWICEILNRWFPNAKLILWLHNEVETSHPVPLNALKVPDHIVAVSRSVREWTLARYELNATSITVIHNGVDHEAFKPASKSEQIDRSVVRVLCHGRLDPNKGFDIVAEAVRKLRGRNHDVTLTIAGPQVAWGISPAQAKAYAMELIEGLKDGTGTYLGYVPPHELPDILRKHDIACAISRNREPFGLAALEAMASGCATVVSDMGGLPELAGDGCIVVRPTREAVERALESLVVDRRRLELHKVAALQRSKSFSWRLAAEHFLGLVEH
jgi:glycosyltransferase involved in cell wall biosynthesis